MWFFILIYLACILIVLILEQIQLLVIFLTMCYHKP